MATVSFLYRSKKEEAPLTARLLFRHNKKDYVFAYKIQLRVTKTYWENVHSKNPRDSKLKSEKANVLSKLSKVEKYLINAFLQEDSVDLIDKKWLGRQIGEFYNPEKSNTEIPKSLIRFIDYYVSKKQRDVNKRSISKYETIKRKMERFETYLNRTIMLIDINESFKDAFSEYYDLENYSQNTKQREFAIIKMFCRYAFQKGIQIHPEALSLKFSKETPPKVYLDFDELKKIENAKLEYNYQENARDWLIVSCYTGQRISDFMRFNKKMLREENGKILLEFKQQKTGKLMTIPLLPKVQEILDKHNGEFPRPISSQRYNNYIKEVAKLSGINQKIKGKVQKDISEEDDGKAKIRTVFGLYPKYKLVTSHIGRRSFATNYYGKIPTTLLINVTGHSTESMFLNYIGKSNKDLALELTKYF
ncbi:phage integrase SAM-like domain-containing protein [Psychroserpens sp. S379A]|uniref:site-specific integrase n=1 Tax=Psychroserpens sp. S379A TaxID=3415137 RepID=UPI003C7D109C